VPTRRSLRDRHRRPLHRGYYQERHYLILFSKFGKVLIITKILIYNIL